MFYPCGPQRFDQLWQVPSRDALLSGSHYWEMELLHTGAGWWVCAAYPSISRKRDSKTCQWGCTEHPGALRNLSLNTRHFRRGERIPTPIEEDPNHTGVFLDYEAGILSFYDVSDGMAHLNTFHCRFTEPMYPALRLWEGPIGIRKLM